MEAMCNSCQLSNLALKVDQLKRELYEKSRAVDQLSLDLRAQRQSRYHERHSLQQRLNAAVQQCESTKRALQVQRRFRQSCQSRLNQMDSQKVEIQKQLQAAQMAVNYRIDQLHKSLNQTKSMLQDSGSLDSVLKDELLQLRDYMSLRQSIESQSWQRIRLKAKTIIRDTRSRTNSGSESKQPIDLKTLRLGQD